MKLAIIALIVVARGALAQAQPSVVPPEMQVQVPTGSAHAIFASTSALRWDVIIDQNVACVTPCALWVPPLEFVTLRIEGRRSQELEVGYLPPGELMVQAEPRKEGEFAAGVTFTALSGMAVVTGITLTAVGCATKNGTMCNAGLITGGAGLLGLVPSIWLINDGLPRAHVSPANPTVGVAGRF